MKGLKGQVMEEKKFRDFEELLVFYAGYHASNGSKFWQRIKRLKESTNDMYLNTIAKLIMKDKEFLRAYRELQCQI